MVNNFIIGGAIIVGTGLIALGINYLVEHKPFSKKDKESLKASANAFVPEEEILNYDTSDEAVKIELAQEPKPSVEVIEPKIIKPASKKKSAKKKSATKKSVSKKPKNTT